MKEIIDYGAFSIGTWQADKKYWPHVEDRALLQLYDEAIERGMGCFDTAEVYGHGAAEMLLGRSIRGRREHVFIADKVFATHLRPVSIIKSCEKSLRRLGSDYIDLYQIHWPAGSFKTPDIPLENTLGAMLELKQQGKIRHIGVCNFSLEQLQQACICTDIFSIQLQHSLLCQTITEDMKHFASEHAIQLQAYSPFAQGLLTGKHKSKLLPSDHRMKNALFQSPMYEHCQELILQLELIAKNHALTLSQLALVWLKSKGFFPIVGMSTKKQLLQNIHSAEQFISIGMMDEVNRIV